ncbi:MAG: hypothetical protein OXC46_07795 [Thaumarchaeota archaeon]|nr:hypothetical protein [Nitrososphaerota archaeon]
MTDQNLAEMRSKARLWRFLGAIIDKIRIMIVTHYGYLERLCTSIIPMHSNVGLEKHEKKKQEIVR